MEQLVRLKVRITPQLHLRLLLACMLRRCYGRLGTTDAEAAASVALTPVSTSFIAYDDAQYKPMLYAAHGTAVGLRR